MACSQSLSVISRFIKRHWGCFDPGWTLCMLRSFGASDLQARGGVLREVCVVGECAVGWL